MIALFTTAFAGGLGLGTVDEWSLGVMASWRTTPFRQLWGPEEAPAGALEPGLPTTSWYSEPALHAVGSWRWANLDLSIGSEAGFRIRPGSYADYSGFRVAARASVTVLSTDREPDQLDPLNVSVGGGVIGWAVCCSVTGGYAGDAPSAASTAPTVFVANRLWLWSPLGLDLRYEVPLVRSGFLNTVSLGVVFAGRE